MKNIETIKASLARFGQRTPLVVQRQGMIVRKGNGTLEAARALGWGIIAALVVDEGDVPATAYALADNRSGELAVQALIVTSSPRTAVLAVAAVAYAP